MKTFFGLVFGLCSILFLMDAAMIQPQNVLQQVVQREGALVGAVFAVVSTLCFQKRGGKDDQG